MLRFPSPDKTHYFGKVEKKIPDSLVKEASTLIYKQMILSYLHQLSLINIDTTFLKPF